MLNNARITLKDGTIINITNPRILSSILKAQLHTFERISSPYTKPRACNKVISNFNKGELSNDVISGREFLAMLN